jgi:aspartyl-tRNA(Asn)/glutamyl-tRNA(Gln) amidotransferase subunit A
MNQTMNALRTHASLADTAAAVSDGEITSEALVERQLARIARHDGRLHAFVDVYADEARRAARALDQMLAAGIRLGPLHGVTVAVKDLFDIAGHALGAGSRAVPPRVSASSATVVARLRAAGAIVIGKTHTVEYAFGGWGTNAVMGTPWNPWDLEVHRVPGGSSSGSAVAVAADLACAAIGTDTGGSVRIPAGLCGLVGLKTTRGLVSRNGLVELCPTHDTVGPITRTVRDAALMLDVMAGPDVHDPVSRDAPARATALQLERDMAGTRVWVLPESERHSIESDVLAIYDRALATMAQMGMQLVDRPLPQSCTESMRIAGSLMSAEGYALVGELFEQDDLEFDPHVRRRILAGRKIDAAQYIELLQMRDKAREAMLAAMQGVDVCCFPTNAITAIPVSEVDEASTPLSRFGRFVNLFDLCSLALPAGLSGSGLPVSIQVIGRPLDEPLVLQVGHAFERATPWHLASPPGLD